MLLVLFQGTKNHAFGKPCLCPRDTRHFCHFRRFTGFELSSKALVLPVRTRIRHFRRFRQNPSRFGGTKARFTEGTLLGTPNLGKNEILGVFPLFLHFY